NQLNSIEPQFLEYFELISDRLLQNKTIDRRRFFKMTNQFLSVHILLSQSNQTVDELLNKIKPTSAEMKYIEKKLPTLFQHLYTSSSTLSFSFETANVQFEKVFTQTGQPMLIVDNCYLFYKKREQKTMNGTVNYYTCIRSRRSLANCPC